MFNQTNDYEGDFCEAYKSQILEEDTPKKEESTFSLFIKLLTILVLFVTIIAISFYGYNYFSHKHKSSVESPPSSIQQFDGDLVVTLDEKEKVEEEEKISAPIVVAPQDEEKKIVVSNIKEHIIEPKEEKISAPPSSAVQEVEMAEMSEIDKIANSVKMEIAKSEQKENLEKEEKIVKNSKKIVKDFQEEKNLEVPSSVPEAKYLEDLAKLSKEIDKDRN